MNRNFSWQIKGANQENSSPDRGCPRHSDFYEYLYIHMNNTVFALLSNLFESVRHPFYS